MNLLDWGKSNVVPIAHENTVYLWDASNHTARELATVFDDGGPVTSVSWAPYGFHIAIGLDNSQVQVWDSTASKKVISETLRISNRTSASGWETFKLWRIDENTFNFRVFSNQFAGVQAGGSNAVITEASTPGNSETFKIVRNSDDKNRVRIQAPSVLFLQAKTQDLVTADYAGDGGWGDDNPSVFKMTVFGTLHGEFQITNGYGPEKAPAVMKVSTKQHTVTSDQLAEMTS